MKILSTPLCTPFVTGTGLGKVRLGKVKLRFFLKNWHFYMGGGGLNVAYLRTADFCGGLKSGLILLTLGGFLDFYSGNTEKKP